MHAGKPTTLALLIGALCVGTASAEMSVYYHIGSWDAFTGADGDGKAVCGVGSTNPGDNRSFSMRYHSGSDNVVFQARKPTWNIPAGTQVALVVRIGAETPWNMQAVGNAQSVEWTLERGAMPAFDEQFRRAGTMSMSFPSGNEPTWTLGLNGSTAISNAFGRCVRDLMQRTGGSASPGPTQPFGQTPTQPMPPR